MLEVILTAVFVSAINAAITVLAQRAIKAKMAEAIGLAEAARVHALAASSRAAATIETLGHYQSALQPALAALPKTRSRKLKKASEA